ncbi:MAG: hypothetical protein CSA81_09200 [Acidobacteria bacterium]|nr:MAG: hypothetical protein CSA81_09200 [Acidobacteriota bacterium]PIE90121.1 MAG: hypothetical protein CR997_07620 [Acidobacteriota bacterium]
MNTDVFDTMPREELILTPKQYLKFLRESKDEIVSTKIIPPVLGRPGFGKIKVKTKRIRFKMKL